MSGTTGVDLQPDTDEVLQNEEVHEPAVNVHITGSDVPVRVQSLPNRAGATFTKAVTTTAQRILNADHRRAVGTIIASGGAVYVAFSNASAQDPSRMALWPAGVPFVSSAGTEVWVQAVSGTVQVGVLTELWAAGESSV